VWVGVLAGRFILGGSSCNSHCWISGCMSGKPAAWLSCAITLWICIRTYSHSTYEAVRVVKVSKEKIRGKRTLKHARLEYRFRGVSAGLAYLRYELPVVILVYNTGFAISMRTIHGFGWRANLESSLLYSPEAPVPYLRFMVALMSLRPLDAVMD